MTTTTIEILRHGKPEGEGCFRGHTDFALSAEGLAQMHNAVSGSKPPDVIISSPLQRCLVFAKRYAQQTQSQCIIESDFMEINFGDWDGKQTKDVWQQEPTLLSDFWQKPWLISAPNGESLDEFDARVIEAWDSIIEQYKGKHLMLVTHGGVMKQILRTLLEMPKNATYLQRINLAYAAKLKVTIYHDEDGKHWPQMHW